MLSDIEIHAIKTGMLHDTDVILAIVQTLKGHYTGAKLPPIVCDPVCVSTSGHTLLQPGAIGALISNVFPISTLITPNKAEAELLVSTKYPGFTISSLEDMITAATRLVGHGSACLVKGGHTTASFQDIERIIKTYPQVSIVKDELLEENMEILQVGDDGLRTPRLVVDVLDLGEDLTLFVRPFIVSENTHGTGCTLSSAIASELGRGKDCASFQSSSLVQFLTFGQSEVGRSLCRRVHTSRHHHGSQNRPRTRPIEPPSLCFSINHPKVGDQSVI